MVEIETNGLHPVFPRKCGELTDVVTEQVNRTTKDVDVVALCDSDGRLVYAEPLPEGLLGAANQIGTELGLQPGWLNAGHA